MDNIIIIQDDSGYCGIVDIASYKLLLPCKYAYIEKYYDFWVICLGPSPKQIHSINIGADYIPFFSTHGDNEQYFIGIYSEKDGIIIQPNYSYLQIQPKSSCFKVGKYENGFLNYGTIDYGGRIILPTKYGKLICCTKETGIATYGTWSYIVQEGGIPISKAFRKIIYGDNSFACWDGEVENFSNTNIYVPIIGTGTYIFMDKTGTKLFDTTFEDVRPFNEGLAAVRKNSKWGFIDKKGNCVIPFEYEDAHSFCHSYASVKLDGQWGCIDTKNKTHIGFFFDHMYNYHIRAWGPEPTNTPIIEAKIGKYITEIYDLNGDLLESLDETPVNYAEWTEQEIQDAYRATMGHDMWDDRYD